MMKRLLKYLRTVSLSLTVFCCFYMNATSCPSITTFTYSGSVFDCPCTLPNFGIEISNNLITDSLTVYWDFGDGIKDTTYKAVSDAYNSHTYLTAGLYTIWVKIVGPGTCVDSTSMVLDVTCSLVTDTCPTIPWLTHIVVPVASSPCPLLEMNTFECGTAPMFGNQTFVWDFGDGNTYTDTSGTAYALNYQYGTPGVYTVTFTAYGPSTCVVSRTMAVTMKCDPPPCYNCISSFAPEPGRKYLVSGWVKEDSPAQSKTSYTYPSIWIVYPSMTDSVGPFSPSGRIIDGWQRVEGSFTIPSLATDIKIKLNCSSGDDCYFDDIRVQPFDGSMKSFVYDPVNMRLVAELDERNYATLYEYDEEGKLTRVKKETEKGIMTIKESRNNSQKKP